MGLLSLISWWALLFSGKGSLCLLSGKGTFPFGASWFSVPTQVSKVFLSVPCISEMELDRLVSIVKVTLKLLAGYTAVHC